MLRRRFSLLVLFVLLFCVGLSYGKLKICAKNDTSGFFYPWFMNINVAGDGISQWIALAKEKETKCSPVLNDNIIGIEVSASNRGHPGVRYYNLTDCALNIKNLPNESGVATVTLTGAGRYPSAPYPPPSFLKCKWELP